MKENLTAIILAGGKSSRMKSDKALLPVRGYKLIELIINQIRGLFSEILISSSEGEKYDFLSYPVIPDEKPGEGPLVAILSGLRASSNRINFIIACDVPEINITFLRKMLSYREEYDIVVPGYKDGKFEPLFGVYSKDIIPVIEKQIEDGMRNISPLFFKCHTKFIEMDDEHWYRNLNSTEDYEEYIGEK